MYISGAVTYMFVDLINGPNIKLGGPGQTVQIVESAMMQIIYIL